jgi:hypothetical protein
MKSENTKAQLQQLGASILAHRIGLFILLLVIVYAFVGWRVYTLSTVPPDKTTLLSSKSATPHPHIKQSTIRKVKNLQDNSTSVRALFSHSRENPFHE